MQVNQVYNENCLMTLSRMPANFIDLTVTSPPYDKLRTYKGFSFPFKHIARHLYRVTKPGGVVVWIVGDATVNGSESGTSFMQALFFKECGFRLHDTQIYRKLNFAPQNHGRYEQEFEYMFCFSKNRPRVFNPIKVPCKMAGITENFARKGYILEDGSMRRRNELVTYKDFKNAGNIFSYGVGASRKKHPAVFPATLARDQIATWSNEGDLIYDPFGGSGTTAAEAIKLNRNYILSELAAEYISGINEEIQKALIIKFPFLA